MSYQQFASWRDEPEDLDPMLSVVIPAYNESERIVPTIASIATFLAAASYSFEIIVSDDGSTDGTPALCRQLGLRNLIVLDPGTNRGKGAAVRAGVNAANGELILFTDADLSTPIEEVENLLAGVLDADVVIGSRAASGSSEGGKPLARKILSRVSRAFVGAALGLDVADSQCGFKLFRRRAARRLFAEQRIDGFAFDAEILYLANHLGLRVTEVPVRWFDAPGSKVDSFKASITFILDVMSVRLSTLLGRYRTDNNVRDDRLRIGVVTALPPSTATLNEYGHHLVRDLAAVREVSEVVVFAEDSEGVPPEGDRINIVPSWTFDSMFNLVRLVRAVRRERPDVVLFNLHFTAFGGRKVPAALGLTTPLALRFLGTPSVVLLHNLVETTDLGTAGYSSGSHQERGLRAIGRLVTRLILGADHVVTTMPEYVDILRNDYRAGNVSLTPHGAFEATAEPPVTANKNADDRPLRLLAFGKFGTYKRVDDLIDAYRHLIAGGRNVELVIAGTDSPVTPGYLDEMNALCVDLPGVNFAGYIAEDDVASLFLSSDIVVFPYTGTTGSSGPLHQAGSYARPVVAPSIGDFIDLIKDEGYDAAAFEPGDVASLVAAIDVLLQDGSRRQAMGRQNHAAAMGLPLSDIAEWHVSHLRRMCLLR